MVTLVASEFVSKFSKTFKGFAALLEERFLQIWSSKMAYLRSIHLSVVPEDWTSMFSPELQCRLTKLRNEGKDDQKKN